ncbi:flagellar brake protein [Halopseudomonas bauzanensis]|uniref:C-di-GMP-binding flagellar brake protein YcgR, contains PilZNR and PilZ domains n=1 Tax=Halopseudomonas bauzanensis TaxID=653930 RepID=A0A1H9VC31_9GAMM|nr:flagellar brake protein [Halopseudomonas bauzanensis]SES19242.1 c-di-GMP-binding flagellar brake protein YcgR, contains PilZNR and PilZ domains [Halopseudomonas bauzanensis]SFM16702.1 c-di-GMP-binding flagellar brake protein YcgR, contains PilZNR and PilZ domains [Halopseudomonas bauzanensis]
MLFEQEGSPQPPREVTASIEIHILLKNLQQFHIPLSITFDGRSQTFQSYIVDLDTQNGALLIDEMIPHIGDKWASQGESFRIDAWLDGVHMRWVGADAKRVMLEDAPAFSVPLPHSMIYHQRRGAFRATVQRSIDTRVELIHAKHQRRFEGELLDISATGCKARLLGNHVQGLQPGERYELSRLLLPDAAEFDINLEIRHREYHQDSGTTHVGLRFHQPSPQAQRPIDRFVHYLQREARRLEKEDLF